MKAQLKSIYSLDIEEPLENFLPDELQNFCINVRMIVGPKNERGEESFDVIVCTPDWLKENHRKGEILVGRHYLIMFEYNYSNLIKKVTSLIDETTGETWTEIAEKLGRIGYWEFEDYH